jgi:hypothetical protein
VETVQKLHNFEMAGALEEYHCTFRGLMRLATVDKNLLWLRYFSGLPKQLVQKFNSLETAMVSRGIEK